ncbi:MAG: DUF3343 domain-containing protein [Tissierellia bacterium]|nr:DUF3343 domain-containing protein [Tissierellia bacterium]
MRQKTHSLIISFPTTADAMAMEQIAKLYQIDGKLIPVPHFMSTGCGMAWKGLPDDQEKTIQLLKDKRVEWEEVECLEY